jgi:acetyl esterase/lipase
MRVRIFFALICNRLYRQNTQLKIYALACLCWLLFSCSENTKLEALNAVTPTSGYTLVESIAYGQAARQTMDLFQPTEPNGDDSIIVFVHGGAWRSGTKEQYRFVGQSLAEAGFTVLIPNYRHYPEVTYPLFIEDIVDAVNHYYAREPVADEPLPRASHVVLMGHSSGAHTAALLASDQRWWKGSRVSIAGLVALSGPYDLPLDNDEVSNVFPSVEPRDVKPPLLTDNCHPPTLLIHGADDERVVKSHTRRYAQALQEVKVATEVVILDGGGHASTLIGLATPLMFLNDSFDYIIQFMNNIDPKSCHQ